MGSCQLFSNLSELKSFVITHHNTIDICHETCNNDNNNKLNIVYLRYTIGKVKNLRPLVFSCLDKLENLDISNGSLEIIENGAFNGLEKLKSLTLSSNKLTHIGRNIFEKLINLNSLILRNNKINNIDDQTFDKQTLSSLDLSYNELKFINKYTFYGIECKHVYVGNNDKLIENFIAWNVDESKIQTDCIVQGIIQICTKLNSLSSVDVIIHDFSPDFPLPSSKLELSGISSIGRNAFNNSNINAHFKVLEIHYTENHEFIIYPESFEGLINLEDLILNVGAITLTNNLFDKLKSLNAWNFDEFKIQTDCIIQGILQICTKLNALSSVDVIIHDFSPDFPLPSSKLELSGISSIGRNAFQNSNINVYFKVLEIHYTENHKFIIYPESFETWRIPQFTAAHMNEKYYIEKHFFAARG
ncbi:leucine-rich repeat-containing G-protein coupled receptor 5-like [Aphidius gifuensis]|uniref:leucine-rich repeat-containing G-protein coupled receptor 5-like n=1 Tax=Aphidius gifuensis TaxID=684658 RepID=UPI001CDBAAAA|nr:leucine-rich repeat-containing G-protein coupled receptor 5-like [Aphidius gifuensis]